MGLTLQDVEKVSLLARLQLSADELSTMTDQLGRILEYFEQLNELDTTDVQPMAHAIEMDSRSLVNVHQTFLLDDGNLPICVRKC